MKNMALPANPKVPMDSLTSSDVSLIKALWAERKRIREERDECNAALKELTQSKIAEKFDVEPKEIKLALRRI